MEIKTYGVDRLAEYRCQIPVGPATVSILFSGGSFSGYGQTPATYSTDNPALQLIIENSPQYRSGKIRLVRSEAIRGRKLQTSAHSGAAREELREGETAGNALQTVESDLQDTALSGGAQAELREGGDCEGEECDGGNRMKEVRVSCKDAAKQYLQENFGENPAPLRTKQDVQNCGAKHGVVFVFG